MLLCGRILLGARSPHVTFFLEFGRARTALVKFTHLNDASRWTLSFPIFYVVPGSLGEFDGVI